LVLTKINQTLIRHGMTPEQCRAARGWLDISQTELGNAGGVSLSTVRDFEKGRRVPIGNNLTALRTALETRGITFTENGINGPAKKASPI
jgi:DNA-binding transcriptional regulator YiaG